MKRNEKSPYVSRRESLALGLGVATLVGLAKSPAIAQDSGDEDLLAEIEEALRQTQERWNSGERISLREMWDTDDPEPWYVPEEIVEPFTTWPEINAYWSPKTRGLDYFKWGFGNVRAKRLAPDIALALFEHFYELKIKGDTQVPFGGFDRCLAIFRKKPEGWRHILYAQCPLGAETYVRALREQAIQPDFDTFRERVLARPKRGQVTGDYL